MKWQRWIKKYREYKAGYLTNFDLWYTSKQNKYMVKTKLFYMLYDALEDNFPDYYMRYLKEL